MIEERAYWLAWMCIHRVGPILLKRIYIHFGSLAIAWQAPMNDLLAVGGIGEALAQYIVSQRPRIAPASLFDDMTDRFITPSDSAYPQLLFEICDPPPVLYYSGRLELLEQYNQRFSVGVVGTRRPTDYGRQWTRQITHQLVQSGSLIISGLASGIDRVAHQVALDNKGDTIAVLGTGVDVIYPAANAQLYKRISETGLLLSEYPSGTSPDRTNFPKRNRIIAGLSRAVIVTEAPERSGALITAHLANDYGREVYALPGSLDNSQIEGCLHLINQGAQIILGLKPLMEALSLLPPVQTEAASHPELDEQLDRIYQEIPPDGIGLDGLVERLGIDTGILIGALIKLELMGFIQQSPGARYRRS